MKGVGATEQEIFVRGIPQPQGSVRAFRNRKTGQPIIVCKTRSTGEWRQAIKAVLSLDWTGPAIDGPVRLSLVFRLPRPASAPKKRILPERRPDLDKLVRAVLDALRGIVYVDDARVVELVARKVYSPEPGVQIRVSEATDEAPRLS